MSRIFTPVALTANDLLEGDAVWWTGAGWSRIVDEALIAADPEAAASLETLGARQGGAVVGPYLVEIGEGRRPRLRREAIRADREPTFAYGDAAQPQRDAA